MSKPMNGNGSFVPVEKEDGSIFYDVKRPELRKLFKLYGNPPWTVRIPSMTDLIPDEALELIGTVEWRGVSFDRREEA